MSVDFLQSYEGWGWYGVVYEAVRDPSVEENAKAHATALVVDRLTYPLFVLFGARWHLINFLKSAEGRGKALKFAEEAAEVAEAIAKSQGASDRSLSRMHSFKQGISDARTAVGLFDILASSLLEVYQRHHRAAHLVAEWWNPEQVERSALQVRAQERELFAGREGRSPEADAFLSNLKRREIHEGVEGITRLRGRPEIALDLAHEFLNILSLFASLFAFGICRPIQFIHCHFGPLGEGAQKVGSAFGYLMMARQISSLSGTSMHLITLFASYISVKKGEAIDFQEEILEEILARIVIEFLKALEDGLDLTIDVFRNFERCQGVLPPQAKLALSFASSTAGLIRVWLKTA